MFFIISCYFLFQYLVIVSASRYSHSILDVTKASFIIRDKSCFLYHLIRTPRDGQERRSRLPGSEASARPALISLRLTN